MTEVLLVLLHGEELAVITRRGGRLSMDLRSETTSRGVLLTTSDVLRFGGGDPSTWLDNLLPDNPSVRSSWTKKFGLKSQSSFDLLRSPVGWECAGAIQFREPESAPTSRRTGSSTAEPLSSSAVADALRAAIAQTAGARALGNGAFSLAGAQAKLALLYDSEGNWSHPGFGEPTSHILKPDIEDYPSMSVVEHCVMSTAKRLGLKAANTRVEVFDDQQVLIIERYDRRTDGEGNLVRVHQEDLCQATNTAPERKYQSDGGPSPQQIARHLVECGADVAGFLDALIYNWMIAGTDAHAKNYSLLLLEDLNVELAPIYDVASFLPYRERGLPVRKLKLAMRAGARDYTVNKADQASAWLRTADLLGVPPAELARRCVRLAEQLVPALEASVTALPGRFADTPEVEALLTGVKRRSSTVNQVTEAAMSQAISGASRVSRSRNPAGSVPSTNRCEHVGVRSRRQCVLSEGHSPPHRYTPKR